MLLELARLLSLLYSNSRTHGHVNIVFLISGGGSLNYQGSKKWLEDQLESVDSTLLQVNWSYYLTSDPLLLSLLRFFFLFLLQKCD